MPRLDKKVLRRLSDDELREEALRRRRARARKGAWPLDDGRPAEDRDERYAKEILQFYANLELPVGASVEEIEAAYARLRVKYDPDKHAGDPPKRQAAEKLIASLTRAYEGLLAHKARGKTA